MLEITVEPPRGAVGATQRNSDNTRVPAKDPKDMITAQWFN